MKEQIILSYQKGITNSPSDFLCEDGELADCINLEVKEQELRPVEMPLKLPFSLDTSEKLLLVHNLKSDGKFYVTLMNGILRFFSVVDGVKTYSTTTVQCGTVKSIQALGNMIVAYTDAHPFYIQYTNGDYKYLGNKIPDIKLSFNLVGEFKLSEQFEVKTPDVDKDSDEWHLSVTNQLLAKVNEFIETESVANGKFMFPFFIRYAVRLYDGTYCMHSNPVLLLPSTTHAPYAAYVWTRGDTTYRNKTYKSQIGSFVADVKATIEEIPYQVNNWSDIVAGIDFFVSKQIYSIDQSATRMGQPTSTGDFVGTFNGLNTIFRAWDIMEARSSLTTGDNQEKVQWSLPRYEEQEIIDKIVTTSQFYKFASVPLSTIALGGSFDLDGENPINAIETKEQMTDDYMTHDVMIPESTFVYNSRLNMSGVDRRLFSGFPIQCQTSLLKDEPTDGRAGGLDFGKFELYVHIKSSTGGKDIVVRSTTDVSGCPWGAYFFYPDSDAYKIVLYEPDKNLYFTYQMTEHPLLNGAYAFMGFWSPNFHTYDDYYKDLITLTDNHEKLSNKLFTSSVNNLLHFPLQGIYTVGSDKIIGMAAVTRPISQGQFGEFPLMVFCSDGNYAMRVDEEGFYSSISPIQEDTVLGHDKITPMENSVVVITQKGIMLTSGGEMTQIAKQMDGKVFDKNILLAIKTSVTEFANLVEWSHDNISFTSYLSEARMAFDYSSNRLLIYNSNKTYSYLYNFNNGTTTKIVFPDGEKITTSVMDYPDTILQGSNGNLYSLYQTEDINALADDRYGVIVTRPLKMNSPLSLKAINQIKNLYFKSDENSYVKYNLYGSYDNIKYFPIFSRNGKPYKYYRMVLYTCLKPKDALAGTAMIVETRRTNKLR